VHRDGTTFVVLMGVDREGVRVVCRPVPRYVHHVVLGGVPGLRGEGQEARFLNGDKTDCWLANLVWGSADKGLPPEALDRGTS
jgi:hypothetical protein